MKKIYFLTIGTLLLLLTACEHKELCFDHSHTEELQVVFDWKNAPQAQPASMRLYLFPVDGGKMLPYEFAGRDGGKISVPAGTYRALCINNDVSSVIYTDVDRFDDFEAYTNESSMAGLPRNTSDDPLETINESVRYSPDMLWADRKDDIHILYGKAEQSITLYPDTAVCRYTVEVRNVTNLEGIPSSNITGALTGVSGGLKVGRNVLDNLPVTIPFGTHHDGPSTIVADFLAFGHKKESGHKNWLFIYVEVPGAGKYYNVYDVTEQLSKAAGSRHVHILIEGLPLPKPVENEGGLKPEVDDWQEVPVEVQM